MSTLRRLNAYIHACIHRRRIQFEILATRTPDYPGFSLVSCKVYRVAMNADVPPPAKCYGLGEIRRNRPKNLSDQCGLIAICVN